MDKSSKQRMQAMQTEVETLMKS
jgi:hypothetical protein